MSSPPKTPPQGIFNAQPAHIPAALAQNFVEASTHVSDIDLSPRVKADGLIMCKRDNVARSVAQRASHG